MNINLSLPISVNRQGLAGSILPLKENLDRQNPATSRMVVPVVNDQQNESLANGLDETGQRVISGRDRIDLRILRNQSLSLTNQKAVSAYEVSSGIIGNPLTSNYLDIRA